LINCEGYLGDVSRNGNDRRPGVYNNPESLKELHARELILGLANNHVMDSPTGVVDSIRIAQEYGYLTVGAGSAYEDSVKPLVVNLDGLDVAIIAAGWDVIGCVHATAVSQGCAPLLDGVLLPIIKEQKSLGRRVLVFAHWGYELEIYPHPTHRESAREYINSGADVVVGCHAHCLQGYEAYNDKHIFYGLGNAVFKQHHYCNGKIAFPPICGSGLAIKWDTRTNGVSVADIVLEDATVSVSDLVSPSQHKRLCDLSGFAGLSREAYVSFFVQRRRKRRLLPIFKEKDSAAVYRLKVLLLRGRALLIGFLFRAGLKGASR
jgi:hypothetical protein